MKIILSLVIFLLITAPITLGATVLLFQSESEIIWNFLIKLGTFLLVVGGVIGIIYGAWRSKKFAEIEKEQDKIISTRGLRITDLEAEIIRKNQRIGELEYLETLIELRARGDEDRETRRLKGK